MTGSLEVLRKKQYRVRTLRIWWKRDFQEEFLQRQVQGPVTAPHGAVRVANQGIGMRKVRMENSKSVGEKFLEEEKMLCRSRIVLRRRHRASFFGKIG